MDETDIIERDYTMDHLDEGRWLVDGLMSLSDAQRELQLETDIHIVANTLSGLIMERLGSIPSVGDVLVEGRLRLTVKAVEGRHATQLLVEQLDHAEEN